MNSAEMLTAAQRPWNPCGRRPVHEWLVGDSDAEDQSRIKCLGNIVMPACARLGMHLLHHSLQSNP